MLQRQRTLFRLFTPAIALIFGAIGLALPPSQAGTYGALLAPVAHPSHSARFAAKSVTPYILNGYVLFISFPNLDVAGKTVVTNSSTSYGGGYSSFTDIRLGDFVTLDGNLQADGSVLAISVFKDAVLSWTGTIHDVSYPGFMFNGIALVVVVDPYTTYGGGYSSFADIKVGDAVTAVTTNLRSDGSVGALYVSKSTPTGAKSGSWGALKSRYR